MCSWDAAGAHLLRAALVLLRWRRLVAVAATRRGRGRRGGGARIRGVLAQAAIVAAGGRLLRPRMRLLRRRRRRRRRRRVSRMRAPLRSNPTGEHQICVTACREVIAAGTFEAAPQWPHPTQRHLSVHPRQPKVQTTLHALQLCRCRVGLCETTRSIVG